MSAGPTFHSLASHSICLRSTSNLPCRPGQVLGSVTFHTQHHTLPWTLCRSFPCCSKHPSSRCTYLQEQVEELGQELELVHRRFQYQRKNSRPGQSPRSPTSIR